MAFYLKGVGSLMVHKRNQTLIHLNVLLFYVEFIFFMNKYSEEEGGHKLMEVIGLSFKYGGSHPPSPLTSPSSSLRYKWNVKWFIFVKQWTFIESAWGWKHVWRSFPRDDNARVRAAGREGDLGRGALLGFDVSVTDPCSIWLLSVIKSSNVLCLVSLLYPWRNLSEHASCTSYIA